MDPKIRIGEKFENPAELPRGIHKRNLCIGEFKVLKNPGNFMLVRKIRRYGFSTEHSRFQSQNLSEFKFR